MNDSSPLRVAVLGGGVTGLAAAFRLAELDPAARVTLFEAAPRLGGVLSTEQSEGFLIEHAADMFTTKEPWAVNLCARLGLEGELIGVNKQHRGALVVRRGKLYPVPAGFNLMTATRAWPILRSPLLSWRGKLRLAWEYFVPRRPDRSDESFASFTRRRLGVEAYERLVQPLVSGIYTADPEKLSMAAALPELWDMETRHGGLIRGVRAAARRQQNATSAEQAARDAARQSAGARYGLFVAPRLGMGQLIAALADRLPPGAARLGAKVARLRRVESAAANADDRSSRWEVELADGARETFDRVIVTLPAPAAAGALAEASPELAASLRRIEHASTAVVVLGCARASFAHPLNAFGFVVPLSERRRVLAGSFASVKFAGRAADGDVLARVFIGGACQPELAELSDDALVQLAREELGALLGLSGAPKLTRVLRWRRAMPQYHVGHLELAREIETQVAKLPGLALAGNAYRGVGIPYCVKGGEQAAERVLGRAAAAL